MGVRISDSTVLIGTFRGNNATFRASDLLLAQSLDYLHEYRIYTTNNPDIECTLTEVSSITEVGSEYTYQAISENGSTLVLPRTSHVVDYSDRAWSDSSVYIESPLINASYFVGKYYGLKTVMADRLIKSRSFGGAESVYEIPANLLLTSSCSLIIG